MEKRERDQTVPRHTINLMFHNWPKDLDAAIDGIRDFGFTGVVTNVPVPRGGRITSENVAEFKKIVQKLKERNMPFWIYDEKGYPSGHGCHQVLARRPELAAKGLYMRKFELFSGEKSFIYTIDGMSDKIAYAVKYRMDLTDVTEAAIDFDGCEPLPFTRKRVKISLRAGEIAYVFVVKDAYEGSHAVHNCSSREKYINLLEPEAVKEYLRCNYEPIDSGCPEAFRLCEKVFTDEPSLMTAYARWFESFNYALIPYSDRLFAEFEARKGYDLHPLLPLLYESTDARYKRLRVDFYSFVGERVAENYSGQISAWLHGRGALLSGHYLAEENIYQHVMEYGDYVRVVREADYPGMDILQALPSEFFWNAPKYLSMIARKKGTDGFMVEFCPFYKREIFDEDAFENFMGCASILYMYGARVINTYFMPRLKDYDARVFPDYGWGLTREESLRLNGYVGRIYARLEGSRPVVRVAMYYNLEDVMAKFTPRISGDYFMSSYYCRADDSLTEYARVLLAGGINYEFVDREDLVSGSISPEAVIIPACHFLADETAEALAKFEKGGGRVYFTGRRPQLLSGKACPSVGKVCGIGEVLALERKYSAFADDLYITPYENGAVVVYNNAEQPAAFHSGAYGSVYDPDTGREEEVCPEKAIQIAPRRLIILEKRAGNTVSDGAREEK